MFKSRALNKYFNHLYPCLKNRYGLKDLYTKGQITRTIIECGFSKKYIIYALAIFLDKANFESLGSDYPQIHLARIRKEIAQRYFEGDELYSYKSAQSKFVGNRSSEAVGIDIAGCD